LRLAVRLAGHVAVAIIRERQVVRGIARGHGTGQPVRGIIRESGWVIIVLGSDLTRVLAWSYAPFWQDAPKRYRGER